MVKVGTWKSNPGKQMTMNGKEKNSHAYQTDASTPRWGDLVQVTLLHTSPFPDAAEGSWVV